MFIAYRIGTLLLALSVVLQGHLAAAAAARIDLKVVDGEKVIANGKHTFAWEEFPTRMAGAVEKYQGVGTAATELTVTIDGDASATYRQVREVVRACQEVGIEKFVLQFDPPRELTLKLAAPIARAPDEEELPPFLLRLRAKADGTLASVQFNGRVLPSVADMQRELIGIVGDERGPDSLSESVELEIKADDDLRWRHVGEAHAAAAGFKSRGKFVPLLSKIRIFPPIDEEIEEIELIEEVEFEPLEIEEIDIGLDVEALEVPLIGTTPEGIDEVAVEKDADNPAPMDGSRIRTLPPEERRRLAKENGGSAASEAAVAAALKWIASRQAADGGWNFNHNKSISPVDCPDPGTAERARNGATGLALLPFLGASQTHKDGVYKKQVHAGLAYLIRNVKVKDETGSWHEPEAMMYGHGYAAIAMCDAYARTGDKELLAPAQLAVNYIVHAQDPVGGGWRYQPKQAGDTSASTVQIMALKTSRQSELMIPKGTLAGATKFLDSVQSGEEGSKYGYTGPGMGRGTTAMGLLCRTHLGWDRSEKGLRDGIGFLDKTGPSERDMYFNYHATQVMFQYGGEPWKRWNSKMRDMLIAGQSKEGVTAGSWYFKAGDHGSERGGRLYCTALACLILETYYRETRVFDALRPM